jgi:hypothetical protein
MAYLLLLVVIWVTVTPLEQGLEKMIEAVAWHVVWEELPVMAFCLMSGINKGLIPRKQGSEKVYYLYQLEVMRLVEVVIYLIQYWGTGNGEYAGIGLCGG